MMELNQKTAAILEALLENDGKVSIEELTCSLHITKHPLYYHLEHLNQALKDSNLPAIYVDSGELILNFENRENIEAFIRSFDRSHYIFSKEERRLLIVLLISLSDKPVSSDTLCEFFIVSRNTILADISEIRRKLDNFCLCMTSHRMCGYQITGDEWVLRYHLMDCFYQLRTSNASNTALRFMLDTLIEVSTKYVGLDLQKDLVGIILDAEKKITGHLTHNSVKELVNYLLLIVMRDFATGNACPEAELINFVSKHSEYLAAGSIIEKMRELGVYILPGEQVYLTAVLLGSEFYDYKVPETSEMQLIKELNNALITTFEQKAFIYFGQRDELSERLRLHVRALFYRLKFQIKTQNILAEKINTRFSEIRNLTDLTVRSIEKQFELKFPQDEVAYLCIFFYSWMMSHNSGTDKISKRILIVCGAGVGTSLLIKQQLQKILGPHYYYEIKDIREVDPDQFPHYELVVTTTSELETSRCVIKVNPIITEEQAKKLLRCSISTNLKRTSRGLEMLHIVEKFAVINDEKSLLRALRVFFEETSDEGIELHLLDILSKDRVQYVNQPCSAGEAIHLSCLPLEKAGLVTVNYADEILALINDLGCYSEFREGILLAHAQPGKSTRGTGMALTIFKHPVIFKEWGKAYKVIFTLSAVDHESHYPAIKDLLWILSSSRVCQSLINWPGETIEDLHSFIYEELLKRKE